MRRTACTHVSRAMQAARRRSVFDVTSRLGRRAEAGPRRVLPRVRPPQALLITDSALPLLGSAAPTFCTPPACKQDVVASC